MGNNGCLFALIAIPHRLIFWRQYGESPPLDLIGITVVIIGIAAIAFFLLR